MVSPMTIVDLCPTVSRTEARQLVEFIFLSERKSMRNSTADEVLLASLTLAVSRRGRTLQ